MGSMPVGVKCTLTSSLGEFLGNWAGSGILGYRPCWCPSPFPSPSISRCFPFILFTCHWISFVFLLYDPRLCTCPIDPSLTNFLGKFPGLGQAPVPDVVVQEAEQGCTWSRNLDPNLCRVRGRTSDLGI